MSTSEDVEERVALLCALRREGMNEDVMPLQDVDALMRFWDENDPSSTVTGDEVAKLFPTLAGIYEENVGRAS